MSEAARHWREQLEAWALPEDLLARVEDDPYCWPQTLWKRRSQSDRPTTTPTSEAVDRMLGPAGTLLDVGAGRGRASLPFAAAGHRLVAVEPDEGMAAGLAEDAAALGVHVEIVGERWPSATVGPSEVDVAMSAHVVYDVPELGPFLAAMHRSARAGVVIEMSGFHPWSDLAPLYLQIHGLDRPLGPGVDDLVAVVRQDLHVEPIVEHWSRPGQLWFADWDELCDFYGRRLVVPKAERAGLEELLSDRVVESEGRLVVGGADRRMATVWWASGHFGPG